MRRDRGKRGRRGNKGRGRGRDDNRQSKGKSLLKRVIIIFLVVSVLAHIQMFGTNSDMLNWITFQIDFLVGFIAVIAYLIFRATIKKIVHMT
jgi:hypothetical protein